MKDSTAEICRRLARDPRLTHNERLYMKDAAASLADMTLQIALMRLQIATLSAPNTETKE